ncbi:Photosystem I assembly protein Ycf3 [uncultured archaeon]|nr:Photosystem I assembly protein Ycf3 [uncultured archaeon]
MEIDTQYYEKNMDHYLLKSAVTGLDEEKTGLLEQYYSSFHVTSGIGLGHNIHNNLGIAYDKAGRYADAIEELNAALKFDPEYVEVLNNLAVALDKMGSLDEAVNNLKEAIRQRPGYTEAHCNLGTIYAKLGLFDEAIQEINESIRLNPGFAVARNNLGNIYAFC